MMKGEVYIVQYFLTFWVTYQKENIKHPMSPIHRDQINTLLWKESNVKSSKDKRKKALRIGVR